MAAVRTCQRCGFDFELLHARSAADPRRNAPGTNGAATTCASCRTVSAAGSSQGRPSPVLVLHLAGEVAHLRVAVEMARRRIGMGILGEDIGRDSLGRALPDAERILGHALDVYELLAATRPSGRPALTA